MNCSIRGQFNASQSLRSVALQWICLIQESLIVAAHGAVLAQDPEVDLLGPPVAGRRPPACGGDGGAAVAAEGAFAGFGHGAGGRAGEVAQPVGRGIGPGWVRTQSIAAKDGWA
jgi:hypothetical protein